MDINSIQVRPLKKYTYTANGGEKTLYDPDFFGRIPIRVRRDGISQRIVTTRGGLFSTIEEKTVLFSVPAITSPVLSVAVKKFNYKLEFPNSNPLQAGEKIEFLYK